jgi:hypothetical protein
LLLASPRFRVVHVAVSIPHSLRCCLVLNSVFPKCSLLPLLGQSIAFASCLWASAFLPHNMSSSLIRVPDTQVTARNLDSALFERQTLMKDGAAVDIKECVDTSTPHPYADLDPRNGLCPKAPRWQGPARITRFFAPQSRSAGENRLSINMAFILLIPESK